MDNDRTYFMRRAAQERSAASKSGNRRVRELHETMAERYHELAHNKDRGRRAKIAAE